LVGATSTANGFLGFPQSPQAGYQDASYQGDGNYDKTGKGTKITLSNQTTNITLTASSTVDICEFLEIAQSASGITITLPTPTVTTSSRRLIVTNTGSASFIMNSQTVNVSSNIIFYWSPTLSAWTTQPQNNFTSTPLAYGNYSINGSANSQSISGTLVLATGTATTSIAQNITSSSGNFRFTITQAGTYRVSAIADISATTNSWGVNAIYKNGSMIIQGTKIYVVAGYAQTSSCEYIGTFAVGDYIDMYVSCSSGGYFLRREFNC
jgi:hypothetical protein